MLTLNEDHDRSQKIRMQLDQMINQMETMEVGLPLVWLYVWDVIRTEYLDMDNEDEGTVVNPKFNLDSIWDALWNNPVFTLEFGPEQLSEHIREWLMTNEFILDLEDLDV